MAKSILSTSINLSQAASLILTAGPAQTILLRGEPGVGKSSILASLSQSLPEYAVSYIDVANLDLGDIAMPVVDRETMTTHYAPNSRFNLTTSQHGKNRKPVIIMLDELGKASRPVLNMLLPLILERRLGDIHLPTGSIVFATTNLDTDGVQDNIPAHAYNRMTVVRVAKPSVDGWLGWAMENDIAPEVCAFAKQYPQVFDSYTDLDRDDTNPYIFNPLTGQTKAFVSPRSLAATSTFVSNRETLGDALLPALCGTVGEAAARDMDALLSLADALPSFDAIVAAPSTTKIPSSPAALFILAFMLVGRVEADTLDPVMEYMTRVGEKSFEANTLFIASLAGSKKVAMACRNRSFTAAAAKCGKYF